ncbi:Com family DNA-binding transcriptional regulator [Zophobihabitans entericus]|uniref:Com family DNA-binding transcriptional regulator n=1 Tax=Zophobihabitans entericus TaxID=1635327 RepID=A0A6G9ID35_9GAMM|nr:Com family DNA-binding transcriptional regulator [Zophobihabitans entericus]
MQEIRCTHCNKKLAEGTLLNLRIKCLRCKSINYFSTH